MSYVGLGLYRSLKGEENIENHDKKERPLFLNNFTVQKARKRQRKRLVN